MRKVLLKAPNAFLIIGILLISLCIFNGAHLQDKITVSAEGIASENAEEEAREERRFIRQLYGRRRGRSLACIYSRR